MKASFAIWGGVVLCSALGIPAMLLSLDAEDSPVKNAALEQRLREINLAEARTWDIYLDAAHQTKADFIERPVYLWTNPTKGSGQYGSVFLWVYQGRPAAIGSFFGHPMAQGTGERRRMVHEFHALAPIQLLPVCHDGDGQTWQPTEAISLRPLPDAPAVEASPARRLLTMRNIGRQFGGYTVDWRKQRWELRLLPQPLFRYEKSPAEIIDGALLALVTDAGTDPEVLLLLEAQKEGGWHYAVMRFSDSSVYVRHGDKEIFTAVRGVVAEKYNAEHTYQVLQKRYLDELNEPKAPKP